MAQQIITNGESGATVRGALNAMFTELYAALSFPVKDEGITANAQIAIPANTLIVGILIRPDAGSPVVAVGDSPGAGNMFGQQALTQLAPVQMFWPMLTGGTIYITLTGGTVSISILTINNVF